MVVRLPPFDPQCDVNLARGRIQSAVAALIAQLLAAQDRARSESLSVWAARQSQRLAPWMLFPACNGESGHVSSYRELKKQVSTMMPRRPACARKSLNRANGKQLHPSVKSLPTIGVFQGTTARCNLRGYGGISGR